ncbi:MAG: nucleotidyltransferase family protein [Desulfobacterales bacterium]|nr:nucleotidyltransferase family protein [Desulfobacterales bacterium]
MLYFNSNKQQDLLVEEKLTILMCRISLDDEESKQLHILLSQPLNWSLLLEISQRAIILPLFFKHLSQEQFLKYVPKGVLTNLNTIYRNIALQNLRIQSQIKEILKSMQESNIPIILLKGAYLSNCLYDDIAIRPMGDIDILCQKSDMEKASEKIKEIGYKQFKFPQSSLHFTNSNHLIPFEKTNKLSIEIHDYIFSAKDKNFEVMNNIWESAVPKKIYGFPILSLSVEDEILHLSCHLYKHLSTYEKKFYWFCDIHEIIKQNKNQIDWDKLYYRVQNLYIDKQIGTIFYFMKDVWHSPIPENFLSKKDEKKEKNLAKEIFSNNINYFKYYLKIFNDVWSFKGLKTPIIYLLRCFFPDRSHLINRYEVKNNAINWILLLLIHPFIVIFRAFGRVITTIYYEQKNRFLSVFL